MTPTELAEMHGKADALERVNMRVRITQLEAALREIVDMDPLQFITHGSDAATQSTRHLLKIISVANAALAK